MSNAKAALFGFGGLIAAAAIGGAGFYAGKLTERVASLERQTAAMAAPAPQFYGAVPMVAPSVPAQPPQPAAVAQAAGISPDGVPTALGQVLKDPASASRILGVLAKTSGFETGEGTLEHPIYAFFDPRCPYCKKAMGEMVGQAKVKWVPVALLGDLPEAAGTIEGMKSLEAGEAIGQVSKGKVHPAAPTQETQDQLKENTSSLAALYQGAQDSVAVPTFLVPRADGSVQFVRGFDAGDGAKIIQAYGR